MVIHYNNGMITASEMGKRGSKITNAKLTPEQRSKAAKKGWRNRKAKNKALKNEHNKIRR